MRRICDAAQFSPVSNPVDGVTYPGINREIAESIRPVMTAALRQLLGPVEIHTTFVRLSLQGVKAPHQAHTDNSMGQWSAMLYLNRAEHCRGGTALLRHHSTGMDHAPADPRLVAQANKDANCYEAWDEVDLCEMKPNRLFLFPAELFHRAEPVQGFGSDTTNGRLVLTAFLSVRQ